MPFGRIVLFLTVVGYLSACSSVNTNPEIQYAVSAISVIPKPLEISKGEGFFILSPAIRLSADEELAEERAYFNRLYQQVSGKSMKLVKPEEPASIQLKLDPQLNALGGEGYVLSVQSERLVLRSATNAGIFRGIQTIRQLLPAHFNAAEPATLFSHWAIQEVEVTDKPRFRWRGLLLDCCRHFMEKEFVKRYIDLLAFYKMNTLHWHLTEDQGWRIEIDQYPKLTSVGAWRTETDGTPYGGFYTKEDIREVVDYARSRHITIVPEIEMPGHSVAALAAYPYLSCTGEPIKVETEWGVFKDIYCAGNDSTFQFLENVLTEVMELFPGTYIHIGGDEAPKTRWNACPKCQKRMADEGLEDANELQAYFIQRIEAFVNQHDRRIIGWDEILEGGLAENAAVQSWRGFEGAIEAVSHGQPAVVSPTSHAYFDYPVNNIDLQKVYQFDPIPEGLDAQAAQLILGGECNMWSERAPQELVDSKVFPRILAMTEVLWTPKQLQDYPDFYLRVQAQYAHLDALGVDYGLESPPVKIMAMENDSALLLNLRTTAPGTKVSYTVNDGPAKDLSSSAPFLRGAGILKIIPERNGKLYGDTITQAFVHHKAYFKHPELEAEYSPSYTASGPGTLTNGLLGGENFKDGNWQGFWDQSVRFIVDLGEEKTINHLEIGALQYNNAWIFFPEKVQYAIWRKPSDRKKTIGTARSNIDPKAKGQLIQRYPLEFPSTIARFIEVVVPNFGTCPDWHDAAGSPTWLFLDELVVL
ncbi:MAG: beta-N-acetylhexosaminidase [Bacteroidota bacterium]